MRSACKRIKLARASQSLQAVHRIRKYFLEARTGRRHFRKLCVKKNRNKVCASCLSGIAGASHRPGWLQLDGHEHLQPSGSWVQLNKRPDGVPDCRLLLRR